MPKRKKPAPEPVIAEFPEELIIKAAMVAHEANKAWCEAHGDRSQDTWRHSPRWQKESAIAGVKAIIANPEMTPEMSHESWMKLKADQGWVFGEIKDPNAKTHPCMVPYAELSAEQRTKDYIFQGAVHAVLVCAE